MIHFDFTVSDVDAENILGCIHGEINKCDRSIIKCMVDGDSTEVISAYKSRIRYLNELILKMENTRA